MARTGGPRAKTALAFIDKEIAQTKREIATLTEALDGLIAAREALSKTVLHSVLGTKPSGMAGMPRSHAVQQILDGTEKPMSAGEVAEALRNMGRDDDRAAVAQVIYYLERHGHVHKTERGKWIGTQEQSQAA